LQWDAAGKKIQSKARAVAVLAKGADGDWVDEITPTTVTVLTGAAWSKPSLNRKTRDLYVFGAEDEATGTALFTAAKVNVQIDTEWIDPTLKEQKQDLYVFDSDTAGTSTTIVSMGDC
jgi:hypothetical protein